MERQGQEQQGWLRQTGWAIARASLDGLGSSMFPTFRPDGDIIIMDMFVWRLSPKTISTFLNYLPNWLGGEGEGQSNQDEADNVDGKAYKFDYNIRRGMILVYKSPFDPDRVVMKRVIGLPGDIMEVNLRTTMEYNDSPSSPSWDPFDDRYRHGKSSAFDVSSSLEGPLHNLPISIKVPRDHLWMAGDNSRNSRDSRHYGPVPVGLVMGRIFLQIWPPPYIRWID